MTITTILAKKYLTSKEDDDETMSGLTIQWPISQKILDGSKSIETRNYPLAPGYKNKEIAFIETQGKKGKFKARIVAFITFSDCFQYKGAKDFDADVKKHHVEKDSEYYGETKWGWQISKVRILKNPIIFEEQVGRPPPMKYAKKIPIPEDVKISKVITHKHKG